MKPCDICLERDCKAKNGPGSCNCESCKFKTECNKKLRATVRITLKCTQSCSHCCFESSPQCDTHMTVETAKEIAKFLKTNEVHSINLMGGELFCNPNWKEILDVLIPSTNMARIVSNGDWAVTDVGFAEHLAKHKNCYVCLSKDQWHTNKNIEEAQRQLNELNVVSKTSELNEAEKNMVPIGRSVYGYGFYSMFACYCHNPEHQYSFLIDEIGDIYKCGFGVWDYASVKDYIDGGFSTRFKEFNRIFYDTWVPNCSRCISAYSFNKHKNINNNEN